MVPLLAPFTKFTNPDLASEVIVGAIQSIFGNNAIVDKYGKWKIAELSSKCLDSLFLKR